MKKIIAVILTVLMVVPMSMFFASAAATNIAKGASYTYTGFYTDDKGTSYYPDTAAKKLTDGTFGTAEEIGFGGKCWVGLNINAKDATCIKSTGADGKEVKTYTEDVIVDLAAAKDKLTKFVIYALDTDSGISMPKGVEAFVSTDGKNYTSVGVAKEAMALSKNDAANPTYGIHSFTVTPAAAVSARYVKFVVTHGANWAFLSEAEVYRDPDASGSAPVEVKETIAVDGKLDDNGWTAKGWTHFDSTNATVMNEITADAPRSENFDYQFRADDTKLYFGFKSNTKPFGTDTIFGNGKGTNLRLWIFNDNFKDDKGNAYTTYNSFIDFQYQPGKVVILAKNNTTYNGNTGVEFTVAGLDVKTSETDKSWYVEAAIPFASIGATTGTHMYIAISTPTAIDTTATGNQPTNNSWTYGKLSTITQAPVPPATESKQVPSWPYKAWDSANDIDLVFANIKLGTVKADEPDWKNICGDKIADPQYEVVTTVKPATYKPGDTLTVSITVKNIKPEKGLSLIRVLLNYDITKVEPVVKTNKDSNNEEMNAFLVKAPDTIWAKNGICMLDETKGVYDISFLNEKVTGLAKEDGSLVIEVPFKVKANVTGTIAFQIPNGAAGTNAADIDAKKIYGNAGYALATLATTNPSSSTSTPSKGGKPGTGDNGIYAIALIAIVALAGAATVAVKKRSR